MYPDPRRLRFLFGHHGELRAVAWMKLGTDGSLYMSPRLPDAKEFIHGQGINDGKGGVTSLQLVATPSAEVDPADRKISYHASGRVRGHRGFTPSVSLRDVEEPTLISQGQYTPSSRFAVVPPHAVRSTDIVVPFLDGKPYELSDDRPLMSRTFVAPLRNGAAQVVVLCDVGEVDQVALVFPGVSLRGCQDLSYQITFFVGEGDGTGLTHISVLNLS
jgi:hypothetical protein